jgi:hypothetical protein
MPRWARYLATVMALAGIGVCVYFLFYSVPIAAAWFGYLFDGSQAKPNLTGLVNFVGIASTIGTIVLLVGLSLIVVILKRLWLPAGGGTGKAS